MRDAQQAYQFGGSKVELHLVVERRVDFELALSKTKVPSAGVRIRNSSACSRFARQQPGCCEADTLVPS